MFKILAVRVVAFFLMNVWVLGLITAGVLTYDSAYRMFARQNISLPLLSFLAFWYLSTLVIIGVLVTLRGFKFIGRWVKSEDKSK